LAYCNVNLEYPNIIVVINLWHAFYDSIGHKDWESGIGKRKPFDIRESLDLFGGGGVRTPNLVYIMNCPYQLS